MIFKAFYDVKPLVGCIRLSKLKDGAPVEYTLALVHEINGLLIKKKYKEYEKAMKEAQSHGCTPSKWKLKEY